MENRELDLQYKEIKDLIDATSTFTDRNIELQGHWGKYLCVLAAGFLENAVKIVYTKFAKDSSSPQAGHFITKTLEKIRSPKARKFIEVATSFDKQWGTDMKKYFATTTGTRDAINSIMHNRHQIAHGKSVNILVAQVKDYLEKSVDVVSFIEDQCRNRNTSAH